jgi:catechol 2,3-dioxygenase-like lactoylglutathione lyase family enzyme
MFSHIIIGARDLERMGAFYDPVLGALGWIRNPVEDDGGPAGILWTVPGKPFPEFWVQLPWNGLPATWGNGTQVSFLAASRDEVDRAHWEAMRAGGFDEGKPGLRPSYGPDYYGAYFRDPEGNKLCVVHGYPSA